MSVASYVPAHHRQGPHDDANEYAPFPRAEPLAATRRDGTSRGSATGPRGIRRGHGRPGGEGSRQRKKVDEYSGLVADVGSNAAMPGDRQSSITGGLPSTTAARPPKGWCSSWKKTSCRASTWRRMTHPLHGRAVMPRSMIWNEVLKPYTRRVVEARPVPSRSGRAIATAARSTASLCFRMQTTGLEYQDMYGSGDHVFTNDEPQVNMMAKDIAAMEV